MKEILFLLDYKGNFGSKYNDKPYRSGMDKGLLDKYFKDNGFHISFEKLSEVDFKKDWKDKIVLYTSQEDIGLFYKNYIEDIIYGLELAGAIVIPKYQYLKANNNKVFMEILRDHLQLNQNDEIQSYHFGCLEDVLTKIDKIKFPVVLKTSEGAMGSGVYLAKDKYDLIKRIKILSRTKNIKKELWDIGRSFRHKGYVRESKHRKKFIIQNYIPNLDNDWKIYIFGKRYFIFYRPIFKKRQFRASGGGYNNYFYGKNAKFINDIFDFAQMIYNKLDVPNVSLDIAYNGFKYYLFEFQLLYFGTAGILKKYSKEYFIKENEKWIDKPNDGIIEKIYAESIVKYIKEKY